MSWSTLAFEQVEELRPEEKILPHFGIDPEEIMVIEIILNSFITICPIAHTSMLLQIFQLVLIEFRP